MSQTRPNCWLYFWIHYDHWPMTNCEVVFVTIQLVGVTFPPSPLTYTHSFWMNCHFIASSFTWNGDQLTCCIVLVTTHGCSQLKRVSASYVPRPLPAHSYGKSCDKINSGCGLGTRLAKGGTTMSNGQSAEASQKHKKIWKLCLIVSTRGCHWYTAKVQT